MLTTLSFPLLAQIISAILHSICHLRKIHRKTELEPEPPKMASDNEELRDPAVVDLEKSAPAPTSQDAEEEDDFPTDVKKIALIMASVYMSMFLVALVGHVPLP